jgi:hypothetical protein
MELWIASPVLFLIWFVLAVFLHKGGLVHIILLGAISCLVVQIAAFRKARYHKKLAGR